MGSWYWTFHCVDTLPGYQWKFVAWSVNSHDMVVPPRGVGRMTSYSGNWSLVDPAHLVLELVRTLVLLQTTCLCSGWLHGTSRTVHIFMGMTSLLNVCTVNTHQRNSVWSSIRPSLLLSDVYCLKSVPSTPIPFRLPLSHRWAVTVDRWYHDMPNTLKAVQLYTSIQCLFSPLCMHSCTSHLSLSPAAVHSSNTCTHYNSS